jgi:prolyl-tRNA synthetase
VATRLRAELEGATVAVRTHLDVRANMTPGAKYFEWELKGVPLRLELGPRDLEKQQGVLVRRDTREKRPVPLADLSRTAADLLNTVQQDMYAAALTRREAHSVREPITYARFREIMDGEGAFVYAGWCGSAACEAEIKEETKATIRVLPDPEFRSPEAPRACLKCARPASIEALWAKAY